MSQEGKGIETAIIVLSGFLIVGVAWLFLTPGHSRVREMSREKAIINNLRQIAAAGQQYILEEGATTVSYDQLLQEQYFAPMMDIQGERYDSLVVSKTGGVLRVTTSTGVEVAFTY